MTIEQLWKHYELAVVPYDAGEIQQRETRQAFISGINAGLTECAVRMTNVDPDNLIKTFARLLDESAEACKAIVRANAERQ